MFDLKIWLTKWAKGMGIVVLATALLYTADYVNVSELPPEHAFWAGLVIIICSQLGNWIKHTYIE